MISKSLPTNSHWPFEFTNLFLNHEGTVFFWARSLLLLDTHRFSSCLLTDGLMEKCEWRQRPAPHLRPEPAVVTALRQMSLRTPSPAQYSVQIIRLWLHINTPSYREGDPNSVVFLLQTTPQCKYSLYDNDTTRRGGDSACLCVYLNIQSGYSTPCCTVIKERNEILECQI